MNKHLLPAFSPFKQSASSASSPPGLALLASLCLAASGIASTVFREEFDGFGDLPEGFTEACTLREAPPSLKSLGFRPKDNKSSDVYKTLRALPKEAAGLTDFEFRFKFLFPRDSTKSLNLLLVCGTTADKASQTKTTVFISPKSAGIRTSKPGLLPALLPNEVDLDLRPMPDGLWCNALLRSRGKTMELFFENDGRMHRFAQTEVSGDPLLGFNFSGASAFDLDDLEIRSLPPLPPGSFQTTGGVKTALQAAEEVLEIPADATRVSAKFRIGAYPGVLVLKFRDANGVEKLIDVRTGGSFINKPVVRTVNEPDATGKLVAVTKTLREKVALPDGVLQFKERNAADPKTAWSLDLHTRPRVHARYTPEREVEIAAAWETFPAASQSFVELEVHPEPTGFALWLEGRYAGRLETGARPVALGMVLPAHASLKEVSVSKDAPDWKYLPVDIRRAANPGALATAKPTLNGSGPGRQRVSEIPLLVADGPGNADLGMCRENLGSFFLECDGYLSRTPFDGIPDGFLFSVPPAQYTRAWVLCAVEEEPEKNTVLTARLTKFQPGAESGRGPAIADTTITLPRKGGTLPAGVRKVGEVESVAGGGTTLPLYLVECVLDVGSIQEIQFQEKAPWLDFELLGKRNDKDNFYVDRSRKPSDDPSAVHVFAATLERSPVEMFVQQVRLGNVFKPGDQPRVGVSLASREKKDGSLHWTVRDLHGTVLEKGEKPFRFGKAGEKLDLEVAFAQREFGWYSVDFGIAGLEGSVPPSHRASFTLIAKDERKAGYESPYFTWNFRGAHGTIRDIGVSGQLLLDAGIRHTHVESEEAGAAFKLSHGQFPRLRVPPGTQNPADALGKMIRENLVKFPNTKMALVFHESGGGPFPLEIVGGKTTLDEKQASSDKAKADHLELMARAYRENAPNVKLVVGNSGISTPGLLASLFRAGAPREYFDYLGDETVGMTIPPELSVAKENWILKEVARVFGYGDLPISACYEWKSRRSRHLGLARHAEWNVRDILIAHAWKQPLIPTFGLPDVSNSYSNTVWGDGAFTHNPQVYPKPTYPAVATVTQVLDCASFERMVSTGSPSVYVLEFKRRGAFVYALWCARGELEAVLRFEAETTLETVEMLGRKAEQRTASRKLDCRVAEAPAFLVSKVRLAAVESLTKRAFPRDTLPPGAKVFTVDTMERPDGWRLDLTVDPRIDVPVKEPVRSTAFRRPGKFEVRPVRDELRGECLELELLPQGECPALVQEYAFLRLREPVAVPGTPTTIALQVKGNSSWGKIFWEIEDAEGERWISAGSGGYGCDVYDWPEQAGLNFDGWNQLQFPITAASPIKVPSPGEDGFQWQRTGTGNGRVDYPIKVTGIAVSMPRQTLNLLHMEPVVPKIRLGGVSVY